MILARDVERPRLQPHRSGPAVHVHTAHELSLQGRFAEAEQSCRAALTLDGNHAIAHNNLGWARQKQGDSAGALFHYRRALQLDRALTLPRRNLARLLLSLGRRQESLPFWRPELDSEPGRSWLNTLVVNALQERDLTLAGEYAHVIAELRFGSRGYPNVPQESGSFPTEVPAAAAPQFNLTIPKLVHDIEQFEYLRSRGILEQELTGIIGDYHQIIDRLTPLGPNVRVPLSGAYQEQIGHVYNRILHMRDTPRVDRALSAAWSGAEVEERYLGRAPRIVVIDNFLSPNALRNLRLFCLESTVWSGNRYAHGRLGAFLRDGFNCPLLLQIAEELRNAFPRVIANHPLRQLWGFKNGQTLPAGSTTHADFAAVNVNFWITPTEANLDPCTGGLVVHDIDAPLEWDFETYNNRRDIIHPYLDRQQARTVNIPYRENRAIIFDSDLFHATAGLTFRPGYENRRINVTMLYGDRENDRHREPASPSRPEPLTAPDLPPLKQEPAWRSASFSKTRVAR